MTTPTIAEQPNTLHAAPSKLDRDLKVPTIDQSALDWEREVYTNDPTGGQPSRY